MRPKIPQLRPKITKITKMRLKMAMMRFKMAKIGLKMVRIRFGIDFKPKVARPTLRGMDASWLQVEPRLHITRFQKQRFRVGGVSKIKVSENNLDTNGTNLTA